MAASAIGPEAVAKAYLDMLLHEDRIIWQQITTLMGLEVVTIAAGFGVRGTWWAPMALLFGAFFTVLLYLFIHKVRLDRENASDVVNALWDSYVDEDTKKRVLEITGKSAHQEAKARLLQTVYLGGRHVVFHKDYSIFSPIVRAHTLVQCTVLLFLVVDFFLAVQFISEATTSLRSILGRFSNSWC